MATPSYLFLLSVALLSLLSPLPTSAYHIAEAEPHYQMIFDLHRVDVVCQVCEILVNTVLDRLCIEPAMDIRGGDVAPIVASSCDYVDEPGHPVNLFIDACEDFSKVASKDIADIFASLLVDDYKNAVCREGEEGEEFRVFMQAMTCSDTGIKVCPYRTILQAKSRPPEEEEVEQAPKKMTKSRTNARAYKQSLSSFRDQAHRRRGILHGTREEL